MVVGLLGDIHGNDLALAAILAAATDHDVQALLVTGDLVGYYFAPRKVMEMLRPWKKWIARGNHEDMLNLARIDTTQLASIERKYGSGLRVALDELDSQDIEALCTLTHPVEIEIDSCRILLCHGAPWDNDAYVYPDAPDEVLMHCGIGNHDIVVLGHTHHSMVKQAGAALVVNPGSVGQPRDGRPGAAWALLDTERRSVSLRREPYDIESIARDAKARHPELPYLASVLTRS